MTNANKESTNAVDRRETGKSKGTTNETNVSLPLSPAALVEKEWSEAGISNAFIFGKVMTSRQDLFLELLQIALPELHIQSIGQVGKEVEISVSIDAHGVRLDVSAQDERGRMIDVEMQLRDEKNIARRMRYYTGAIDQTILERGLDYSRIPETVVVFITPFDPYGKGLLRYTFRNLCIEDTELEMGDGTTKVILNSAGTDGEASEDLKNFLKLVAGITAVPKGSFADRVQEQVVIARQNAKWRREYMDWKMTLLSEREKGRDEGRVEGRVEGRGEGIILNQIDLVVKKVKKGLSLPEIADTMEMEEAAVRPIWEAVNKAAPEYNLNTIFKLLTH